jgi:D-alanyl-D-alanine carboxypeptidase/D-alanyl-D-alanine-endopeptidase (penicillin-binding protein 4)
MTRTTRLVLVLATGLLAAWPARAGELAAKLAEILDRPDYKHARWGLLVVDGESGKPLYERNADQLFTPASVTKLYSCAVALVELGADHRFETPVYRRGSVEKGTLRGDLILRASGDFTLGGRTAADGKMAYTDEDHIYASFLSNARLTDTDPLAGLKALAKQVKAAGIDEVTGDVLIDERLWERARGSGSGPDVVTPIMVNDNIVDVTVRPAEKEGEPAKVELRPRTAFVQVDARAETIKKGEKPTVLARRVGPQRYVVRGKVPVGGVPQVRICVVDDPAGFARALFIECLRKEGVKVEASPLEAPTAELPEKASYARLPRVALFRSPPLSEALKVTLKVSHNLYASAIPLLLAVKSDRRTQPDGMLIEGKVLEKLGVNTKTISLESGAGGGNADKVTPRATVQLLQGLRKRDDWPVFEAALPILGVDGTLATSVGKDSPARGKVKGKTGTYTDRNLLLRSTHLRAKSLAGVMTTAKGRTLVFAIFVNDVALPSGVLHTREGKVIGQVCEVIQQHAP